LSLDDYSVGFLLQFEKGKTPLEWMLFVVSSGYISNPDDPGVMSLMQRIYKALLSTRDKINQLRRANPNAPDVTGLVQVFEKIYPMLVAEDETEDERIRKLALTFIEQYKDVFKIEDPKTAIEKSERFLDNAKLIPSDIHATLEQIRTMTFREANALITAKPLLNKWEKDYLSNKAQPATINLDPSAAQPVNSIVDNQGVTETYTSKGFLGRIEEGIKKGDLETIEAAKELPAHADTWRITISGREFGFEIFAKPEVFGISGDDAIEYEKLRSEIKKALLKAFNQGITTEERSNLALDIAQFYQRLYGNISKRQAQQIFTQLNNMIVMNKMRPTAQDSTAKPVQEPQNVNPEIEERQKQVLELKQYGHDDKYIANKLSVTTKTVQRDKQALGILKPRKKGH